MALPTVKNFSIVNRPIVLKPTLLDFIRFFFPEWFEADSDHDFSGDRAGGGVFRSIWDSGYRDLGLTSGPGKKQKDRPLVDKTNPQTEIETMNDILRFEEYVGVGVPKLGNPPGAILERFQRFFYREYNRAANPTGEVLLPRTGTRWLYGLDLKRLGTINDATDTNFRAATAATAADQESGANAVRFTIRRFTAEEDPIYARVKKVAIKADGGERDWSASGSSADLFDWLDVNKKGAIAIMVDALSVPFFEHLNRDARAAGQPRRIVYLINSRESLNDAAGKITMKHDPTKAVEFVTVEDHSKQTIVYAATDLNNPNLTTRDLFYSRYNGSLSPVKIVQGLKSVTLTFSEKTPIRQIEIFKGSKEDAHPNAVANLVDRIKALITFLAGGGNQKQKQEYHIKIQQKRSGDGFADLGTDDVGRYTGLIGVNSLPKDIPIMVGTLDKINLAIALGVKREVIFTNVILNGDTHEYWLTVFYQDREEIAPIVRFQNELATYLKPTEPIVTGPAGFAVATYPECKAHYIEQYNANETKLTTKFTESITLNLQDNPLTGRRELVLESVSKRFNGIEVEKLIKGVLFHATTLAIYRTTAAKIELSFADEAAIFAEPRFNNDGRVHGLSEPAQVALVGDARRLLSLYSAQLSILQKAASAFAGTAGVTSALESINRYLEKFTRPYSDATVAQKERFSTIDKLTIFGRGFLNPSTIGQSGVGIFSFLATALTAEECNKMIEFFIVIRPIVPNDSRLADYDTFLKISNLLTRNAAAITKEGVTVSGAPTAAELPNSSVFRMMAGAMGKKGRHLRGGAPNGGMELEPEPNDTEDDFNITDYFLAAVVLASRFQAAAAADPLTFDDNAWADSFKQVDSDDEEYKRKLQMKVRILQPKIQRALEVAERKFARGEKVAKVYADQLKEYLDLVKDIRRFDIRDPLSSDRQKIKRIYEKIINQKGLLRGGGNNVSQLSDHTSLTTYYLLLRELSFRLSQEETNHQLYTWLSDVILTILHVAEGLAKKASFEHALEFLSYCEAMILGRPDKVFKLILPQQMKKMNFTISEWELQELSNDIVLNYYGTNKIPEDYLKKFIHKEGDVRKLLIVCVNAPKKSYPSPNEQIQLNLAKMEYIIDFLEQIEAVTLTPVETNTLVTTTRTNLPLPRAGMSAEERAALARFGFGTRSRNHRVGQLGFGGGTKRRSRRTRKLPRRSKKLTRKLKRDRRRRLTRKR